jgi:hypothetical protein
MTRLIAIIALLLVAIEAIAGPINTNVPNSNIWATVWGRLSDENYNPVRGTIAFMPADRPATNQIDTGALVIGTLRSVALTNGGFQVDLYPGVYSVYLPGYNLTNHIYVAAGGSNNIADLWYTPPNPQNMFSSVYLGYSGSYYGVSLVNAGGAVTFSIDQTPVPVPPANYFDTLRLLLEGVYHTVSLVDAGGVITLNLGQ